MNKNSNNNYKIINVDKDKVEKLIFQINKKNSINSLYKYIKLFSNVINDNNKHLDLKYQMNEEILQKFINFFIVDISKHLKNNLKMVISDGKFNNYWAKIIYIKYIKNLIQYIDNISDDNLLILLNNIDNLEIIFPFKYLSRNFIKSIIYVWSTNQEIIVKIKSFMILKNIMAKLNIESNSYLIGNKNELNEYLLKFCYLNFYKNNNKITYKNYDSMIIMCNTFAELVREDLNVGYLIIFNILKKLTENLSNLLTNKNKDNIHTIYNNQVLNSIRLITKSIIDNKDDSDFNQLIFPLVEFIKGLITLYESHEFIPLKLKLIEILLHISETTKITLSVFNYLYNLLHNKFILKLIKKKEKFEKLDLAISIKVNKNTLSTNQFWVEILKDIIYLFYYQLFIMNNKIYFNEYVVLIMRFLKKISKNCENKFLSIEVKKLLSIIKKKYDENFEERLKVKKSPISVLKSNKSGDFKFKNKSFIKEFLKLKQRKEENLKSKIWANK